MVGDKVKEVQTVIKHISTEALIADPLTKDLAPKLFKVLLKFRLVRTLVVLAFI